MSAPAIISSGTAAGGPPVGGGGTSSPSTIPRWTGPSTLGDSGLTDDGTTITAANRALSWTRTSGLVGTFNRQDGNEAILALATSGAVRGYVGAGASKAFNVFNAAATSELVTVLNGGNVGIGTASPLSLLHVRGSSASAVQAFIHNANGGTSSAAELVFGTYSGAIPTGSGNPGPQAKISAINTNVATAQTDLAFYTYPSTGFGIVERARIDSAGRLQVGASNAAGAAANTALLLRNPAATNNPAELLLQNGYTLPGINSGLGTLKFQDASGNTYAQISAQVDAADGANDLPGRIVFSTVPDGSNVVTERARIDSAGRLLVGTTGTPTSAQVKAVVAGAGNGGQEWAASAGGGLAIIPETAGTGSFFTFTGNVGAESYTQSFKAISTGLDVSTAGYGLKLNATPGNPDAQTLDCYLDGGASGGATWAPVDNSGAGLTFTVTSARYMRIGRLVLASFDITFPATASGAQAKVSLPVTAQAVWQGASIGFGPNVPGLSAAVNNADLNFWTYGAATTNAALSGARLIVSMSYFAN